MKRAHSVDLPGPCAFASKAAARQTKTFSAAEDQRPACTAADDLEQMALLEVAQCMLGFSSAGR